MVAAGSRFVCAALRLAAPNTIRGLFELGMLLEAAVVLDLPIELQQRNPK